MEEESGLCSISSLIALLFSLIIILVGIVYHTEIKEYSTKGIKIVQEFLINFFSNFKVNSAEYLKKGKECSLELFGKIQKIIGDFRNQVLDFLYKQQQQIKIARNN